MIVSAISLWKKLNIDTPLCASEWDIEERGGATFSNLAYSGHAVADGSVRIFARFCRPTGKNKTPAILLLPDAGKPLDRELAQYFLDKGYAVLMPDYSGKMPTDTDSDFRTLYPPSLDYGNYVRARGLYDMENLQAEQTTWVEWLYVALFSVKYLRSREDIGNIGVVGVRKGGDLAWQAMLSPDIQCGVPINAVGWHSFADFAKFGDSVPRNLSDDTHRYIAGVEAQSYASSVSCPVLMLCALRDTTIDCDRAYDTYSRIGNTDGNALVYSSTSGACIDPVALNDLDLFLEKNLKGREIYIPATLNIGMQEVDGELEISVECDEEGILEEVGIYYAEADTQTKCAYRDWHHIYSVSGKTVKNGKITYKRLPFRGAKTAFAYAYAKFINGFTVTSKITAKRLSGYDSTAIKDRKVYSGKETDVFSVAEYKDYSIADIFLEREAVPKTTEGYGGIKGAFSVGGIKTYKISSPRYVPDENAFLEFDAYVPTDAELYVTIEVGEVGQQAERYTCTSEVKGGGKWKRIILKSSDFKSETSNLPLKNFNEGRSLSFACPDETVVFSVTNILWL